MCEARLDDPAHRASAHSLKFMPQFLLGLVLSDKAKQIVRVCIPGSTGQLVNMAGTTGLEPAASAVTGYREMEIQALTGSTGER